MTEWKTIDTAPKDGVEVWLGASAEEPEPKPCSAGLVGRQEGLGRQP